MYKVGDEVVYAVGTPRVNKAKFLGYVDNLNSALLLDDVGFEFIALEENVEPFLTPDSIIGSRVKGKGDCTLWKKTAIITNTGLNRVYVLTEDSRQYWCVSIHDVEFVE